jgi:hypothetical protein
MGEVAGAALVSDEDNILILGKTANICVNATEIPLLGRTSHGNVMIKNNIVTGVVKL